MIANRRTLGVLIALLGLTITACERKGTAVPDRPPAGLRFLALGDSYTIGESVPPAQRWPAHLARRLQKRGIAFSEIQYVATTGWTADELSRGIDAAQPSGTFDLVTLLIGVNNQYRGLPVRDFRPQFVELLDRAVAFAGGRKQRVIVVSIPDWGVMPFAEGRDRARIASEIDAFNDVCRDESAARGVRFVDITAISRRAATQPALAADDGLHPSGRQYDAWAQEIATGADMK